MRNIQKKVPAGQQLARLVPLSRQLFEFFVVHLMLPLPIEDPGQPRLLQNPFHVLLGQTHGHVDFLIG